MVSQEPILYARSIRRNICFGLEKEDGCSQPPTEEEIIEAAKQVGAACRRRLRAGGNGVMVLRLLLWPAMCAWVYTHVRVVPNGVFRCV